MRALSCFLFCLLTTQAAVTRKSKRGYRYSVREVPQGGGGNNGYHYDNPSGGGGGDAMSALMMAHHDAMNSYSSGGGDSGGGGQHYEAAPVAGTNNAGGSEAGQHYEYPPLGGNGNSDNSGAYHYNAPAAPAAPTTSSSAAPAGFKDIQSFSAGVTAALQLEGDSQQGSGHSFGNMGSLNMASFSNAGTGGYDFNAALSAGPQNVIGGSSGSSDQFTGVQGEVIDEHPPSIFKYKPYFGGKDINNLPHILPPGGKSIQELQDEADAKLRAIVAKAKMNQMEVLERIAKLKTNYGYGTLGYEGFKDTRFHQKDKIDLGSHKAIDLGTSIDYNALKGSNGKLKLPVQNVYHTKTLGIHIPQPYPVKHEVAVPAPFPVPHPIPIPQHKPTPYSPLSHDDIAHLTADDGRGSHFGSFGSFGGFEGFGGQNFDFKLPNKGAPSSYQSAQSGSVSIEPSQTLSESSSIGGLPYGAGTPNAAQEHNEVEYTMEQHSAPVPASMFGLPVGSTSGALSSYQGSSQDQSHYQHSGSQGETIASEAGAVQIPQMDIMEESHENREEHRRPHTEYGPPR